MYDGGARLSEMLFTRESFPYRPSLQSYNCERVLDFVRIYLHYFFLQFILSVYEILMSLLLI